MAGYIKGNIDFTMDIGSLAASDVISQAVADSVSERSIVTSVQCSYALSDFTPAAGEGPLSVGVCHGDYTDAELEEWIELSTGWDVADLVSREVSGRKIRKIGTFAAPSDPADIVNLFDGRMRKTKLNWILNSGQTIRFWIYNAGAQLGGTTPDLDVQGHANIFTK